MEEARTGGVDFLELNDEAGYDRFNPNQSVQEQQQQQQ